MSAPIGPAARPHGIVVPRLYRYIDAIVRNRSIRKAAVEIGIASSALNRRLLDAEADYGTPLFVRLRHGLRLSPAGELVAQHVRATLEDAARLT